jgi:hypothetical protein
MCSRSCAVREGLLAAAGAFKFRLRFRLGPPLLRGVEAVWLSIPPIGFTAINKITLVNQISR